MEPLYDSKDVTRALEHFISIPYGKEFEVRPGIRATFVDAGHILGSASVVLDCRESGVERRLVFSGDIGSWGLPIIRDPVIPSGANAVIMESSPAGPSCRVIVFRSARSVNRLIWSWRDAGDSPSMSVVVVSIRSSAVTTPAL